VIASDPRAPTVAELEISTCIAKYRVNIPVPLVLIPVIVFGAALVKVLKRLFEVMTPV
jgi:hypothetical protein